MKGLPVSVCASRIAYHSFCARTVSRPRPSCSYLKRVSTVVRSKEHVVIPVVKLLELVTIHISQTRALVGAHQGPVGIILDALHEEIGNPEGVEEIASANFFLAVVLP